MPGRKINAVKAARARVKLETAKERRDAARTKYENEQDRLHSEVYKAAAAGMTYVQLAETLGVSKVYVHKILSEQRELRASA